MLTLEERALLNAYAACNDLSDQTSTVPKVNFTRYFNIANHANFGPPPPGNRQIFSAAGAVNATAGLLNATSTTSRQMQFALKFIW